MPVYGTKEAFEQVQKLVGQGQFRAAYRTSELLYKKNPYFPPVVALHVSVILHLQRIEEGVRIAARSLRHISNKPHRVAVLSTLAEGLTRAGNLDEAISLFRDEIANQPEATSLVTGLGHVLLIGDQKKEAIAVVEEATERGVRSYGVASIFGRALLRTDRAGEAIEMIEGLIEDGIEGTSSSKSKALNALGHLYDRTKRYGDAMKAFTEANELGGVEYIESRIQNQVNILKASWTAERFEGVARPEPGMPRPVFILGMPRSGTTLTEQIIDAHPKGYGAGELGLIPELFWKMSPDPKSPYRAGPEDYDPAKIVEFSEIYRRETLAMAGSSDVEVITDKAPMNFWHMALIALALPDARIVHCRREPRDNCLSCFFQSLNSGHSYSYDLGNCGRFYRHYRDITDHYTKVLADDRVGVPVLENQYEEMVADQEGQTRKLLDFVGLDFDESCLNFHESGRVAMTLSNDQVRQPMYQSSTKRYERYDGHIDALVEGLGDVIAETVTE